MSSWGISRTAARCDEGETLCVILSLLELEEVEQSSRRSSQVAGWTCFCLRRDRALPIPSRTGGTSKATRTIPPVDTFGLGQPIDRGHHGCASSLKAPCSSSFLESVERLIITREIHHEPLPVFLQTTKAQTGITTT